MPPIDPGVTALIALAFGMLLSVIAYAVYAADKRAAVARRQRTPESTLLLIGLLGGWPGAVIAQRRLRHKTRKTSFLVRFWFTVVLNVAAVIVLMVVLLRMSPA